MAYESEQDVAAYLDGKFGKGKWKFTSGYRTRHRENVLREEGAGTVAPGHVSDHSKGTPDAPGAVDVTVEGMSASQVADALKDGPFSRAFAERRHGPEGAHVHADTLPALPEGYKLASNDTPAPSADPPLPSGYKFSEEAPAKPAVAPAQSAPPKKTPLQIAREVVGDAATNLAGIPAEGFRQGAEAQAKLISDVKADLAPKQPTNLREMINELVREQTIPLRYGADAIGVLGGGFASGVAKAGLGDPVVNTLKYFAGGKDPYAAATGGKRVLDPQATGDLLMALIPGVGEASAERALVARAGRAGVAPETLKAAEAVRARQPANSLRTAVQGPAPAPVNEHRAAVQRLEADGVRVPAHQRAGGAAQRFTEAAKSDFHVGGGIRDSERVGLDDYNRAFYNRVLKPIGEKVAPDAPVGRQGVADVGDRIDAGYKRVLPQIQIKVGPEFNSDLDAITREARQLGPDKQAQFKAIVDQEVRSHFGTGDTVGGRTWKDTESELSRRARDLRGSRDPNDRDMARLLDQVNGLTRRAMEESAGPKLRGEVRNLNESWAMLTRLEDASSRRLKGGGYVTPTDVLAAVKKGDSRVRKRGFGRGEAMLQQFGEDGERVLGSKVADSGTAERQIAAGALGVGHGLLGAMAGHAMGIGDLAGAGLDLASAPVTNSLARRVLTGRTGPRALPRPSTNSLLRFVAPAALTQQQGQTQP